MKIKWKNYELVPTAGRLEEVLGRLRTQGKIDEMEQLVDEYREQNRSRSDVEELAALLSAQAHIIRRDWEAIESALVLASDVVGWIAQRYRLKALE